MIKTVFFPFLLIFFIPFLLVAGLRDFSIKQYGIDQNFNGIFIYSIAQDKDGYLWLGTDDGLYRFDGKTMINLNKSDSAIGSLVTASALSEQGHLYVGFYKGGVSIVEYGKSRILIQPDSLPSKINKLFQDNEGTIWVLSQNSGLAKISGNDYQLIDLELLEEVVAYDVIRHRDHLFVATNEGLMKLIIEDDESISSSGFITGSFGKSISSLYKDPYEEEVLWVGSENGLFYLNLESGEELNELSDLRGVRVTSIAKDQLQTLWIGSSQSGLMELTFVEGNPNKITRFDLSHGFPSNQINSLYVDRENEVWVGTFGNGLVQLNRSYFHHYELNKSAGIEGINDFHEINEDLYYIATDKGLVKAFNLPGRDSLNFQKIKGLSSYSIICILMQEHIMWLGTANNGLIRFDTRNNQLKKIELNPVDPGLSHLVRYLAEGQDGSLWVSFAGNGAYNLTLEGKLIKHFNTRNGFYHNEIFSILPDEAGNIWFGAHSVGLAILKANGELEFLTKDEIFPGRNINSISQDDTGKIWIATAGEGLYGFDGEEFELFDETNGLVSNFCNAVEVDNSGQIWVGHRMGLSLIQPEYKLVRKFDHPSELGETEAVINSVEKDEEGNIWFGHPYGITKVIAPHINHKIEDRETLIQRIRLYFDEVDLMKYTEEKKQDQPIPSGIEFEHNDNHITFDFVAINLRNPQEMFYQYQLDGYDKEWSPVTTSTAATFTNLDPGKYTFKVRESNHPEYWNDYLHKINFKIDSPYWEKWWFYIVQIGFIMGVMLFTIRLSQRIQNHFLIRLMVYISIFLIFEYIHTELEPYIDSIAGETPIFQVGINLILALLLLPVEFRLAAYLRNREARRISKLEDIVG